MQFRSNLPGTHRSPPQILTSQHFRFAAHPESPEQGTPQVTPEDILGQVPGFSEKETENNNF